jgi:16S rRNA (cytosine967-C5)-methyltransferase
VFRDEGERQIDAFLQRHGDATVRVGPHAPGHRLPLPENRESPNDGAPDADRPPIGDGFFHALIERRPTDPAP